MFSHMDNQSVTQQICSAENGSRHLRALLTTFSSSARRTVDSYERELIQHRSMEIRLRDALAESEARLRQQDELIQKQELLSRESDHRLMNDLQMTISLLSLQSRSVANAEAAAQLAVAANRVSMIARIHHRLHSCDGLQAIELRKFLEDFARDFWQSSWPFHPRPEVFYAHETSAGQRAALARVHAKLVVVDARVVYVSSANFTRPAFHRNLEAGIRVSDQEVGRRLTAYFDRLIEAGYVRPLENS